jgi:Pyruvate/2-oxoacid:ferredoxin oxidoreductase delta subunit
MTELERIHATARESGEPVDPRRPPPCYLCQWCSNAWVPVTTYEKTHQDVESAFASKPLDYRRCAGCGGSDA